MNFISDQLKLISAFGSSLIAIILAVFIVFLFLVIKKHYLEAILNLFTVLSYPLSLALKNIFKEPRPSLINVNVYTKYDIYGFPSGHVFFYTAFWGFLIYLTFRSVIKDKLFKHVIRIVSIYMITFIGISRVVLKAHWIGDVVGGYFFGLIYLAILIFLDLLIQKRRQSVTKNKHKNN